MPSDCHTYPPVRSKTWQSGRKLSALSPGCKAVTSFCVIKTLLTTFLWLSEKDGFMNIYKYDISRKLEKQLTHFNWVIKDILGFDKQGKYAVVLGTGPDARETKAYKINFTAHLLKLILFLNKE